MKGSKQNLHDLLQVMTVMRVRLRVLRCGSVRIDISRVLDIIAWVDVKVKRLSNK